MSDPVHFILSKDHGVTEDEISTQFPAIPKRELAKTLNTLLKTKQIDIHNNGHTLVYKKNTSSMDEERIIYSIILDAHGKGVWLRDLKMKSNIPQNIITRILSQMVAKKIIKSVKSVKTNRKVYVLYDENPGEDITGGVWFNDGDLDDEFVDEMIKLIERFLESKYEKVEDYKLYPTLEDVYRFVEMSNVSQVRLGLEDVESLLKVMVYDEKVEELETEIGVLYMPLKNNI